MKFSEIVGLVKDSLGNSVTILDRVVELQVINERARMMQQTIDKNGLPLAYMQTLYVELELITDCGNDCAVLKSKLIIPKTIRKRFPYYDISNLNTSSVKRSFSYLTQAEFPFHFYNKYTKNNITYTVQNDYLYLNGSKLLTTLMLTDIFENPIEIDKLFNCVNCGQKVSENFPMPLDLIPLLVNNIKAFYQVPKSNLVLEHGNIMDNNPKT